MEARAVLGALGDDFACEVFSAGSTVLERMAMGDLPALLILDWELPDVTGVDVCRFVRTTRDAVALPIILLTGRSESGDVVEGLTSGANDFVSKPFHPAVLLARVQAALRLQELHRRSVEAEAQLATTLRSIGDAVIATDASGQIRFMNAVAEQLTGWAQADAIGRPLVEVFRVVDEATRAPLADPIGAVMRAGGVVALPGDALLLRPDGSELPVDDRAAPIRDEAGGLTGVVLVFRDIADQRRAAAETRSRAVFERQLIGIVSHDLRGPLSTILLGTQVLMAGDDVAEKSLKSMARIQSAAERGARMVNDLLDFTQARVGGGIPVTPKPGNLNLLVRQVTDEVGLSAADRELVVTTRGDGHGAWDLDRMSQVLFNLVTNAVKYSAPASVVRIESEAVDDRIVVSVHNTGAPIAEELLELIFHPMQRATSNLENRARSVGLGLFIVKHLVEAHGGAISVRSTADAGTTFSFWVPRHRA